MTVGPIVPNRPRHCSPHAPIRSHCGALGITPPTVSRQYSAASVDAHDTGCWLLNAEYSSIADERKATQLAPARGVAFRSSALGGEFLGLSFFRRKML